MPETSADTSSILNEARRHRREERRVFEHVRSQLNDRRFIVVTAFGPRPASTLRSDLRTWDRGSEVKRVLLDLDKPDYELQDSLPSGLGFDCKYARSVLLAFSQTIGHVRFASLPPLHELAAGESPQPLSAATVRQAMLELPHVSSERGSVPGPMTLILLSTAGFTTDARETARRFVEGPPTILIEPNDAGGFTLTGPPGSEPLLDLLDPESDADQAARARQAISDRRVDLLTGGVSLDAVARQTQLPLPLVERTARAMASESGEGLRVKAVDGVPMLYRDSSVASSPGRSSSADVSFATTASSSSPSAMTRSSSVLDRLRTFFGGSTEQQRKIAYLAERRAALSRQRDLAYEELGTLEEREQELRDAFKATENVTGRRRLTSQIVQLQKDVERRRQTVGLLNQQINVVGTHLHNLEIARQGSTASLPSAEDIAQDAARAEEVLAELQASSELADELMGNMATIGLSDEEAALYEQLAAEAAGSGQEPASVSHGDKTELPGERLINAQRARDVNAQGVEAPAQAERGEKVAETTTRESPASPSQRAEPEAG